MGRFTQTGSGPFWSVPSHRLRKLLVFGLKMLSAIFSRTERVTTWMGLGRRNMGRGLALEANLATTALFFATVFLATGFFLATVLVVMILFSFWFMLMRH